MIIGIDINGSYESCKTLQENGIKAYLMKTRMNENIKTREVE